MTDRFVVRATKKDKADVAIAAQNYGMDTSAYIRFLLIREKVISPTG